MARSGCPHKTCNFRVVQEPNRNWKPEPLEPTESGTVGTVVQKPKPELLGTVFQRPNPKLCPSLTAANKYRENYILEEPSEPKTGTTRADLVLRSADLCLPLKWHKGSTILCYSSRLLKCPRHRSASLSVMVVVSRHRHYYPNGNR